MIQIIDLKNMHKKELRAASNQILALFQDNYPDMVATKVCNYPKYICFFLYQACFGSIYFICMLMNRKMTLVFIVDLVFVGFGTPKIVYFDEFLDICYLKNGCWCQITYIFGPD